MVKTLTYKSFLRLQIFQPKLSDMSLLNCVLVVLVCLCAHVLGVLLCFCAYVLICLRAWRVYVHSCLACLGACVFTCSACLLVLCPYVLTCFTCMLCSNMEHAYVLAFFFNIFCPIFFAFEKLTSKIPHIEKTSFYSKKYLEPT